MGESLSHDFAGRGITDIAPHHYAFQVSESERRDLQPDEAAGLEHYAEPDEPHPYHAWRGGRAVYFNDPAGHTMEVLTGPAH